MVPRLVVTLDGALVREHPLEEETVSIGRRHGNDIQLNDMTVSGRHALVSKLSGEYFVEDLGSTNGTLVNGSPVGRTLLRHGDVIQTGAYQLTFLEDRATDYEPTMFIQAEMAATRLLPRAPDAPPLPAGLPLGALRVRNGAGGTTVWELRRPLSTLGYNGLLMAVIARGPEGYTIAAARSRRSRRASDVARLNGRVLGGGAVGLRPGDRIEVCGFAMEFVLLD